jgi:hypothetical protein
MCISDGLIPTIIHASGVMNKDNAKSTSYFKKNNCMLCKGYIYRNKGICSLMIGVSIVDCFINLSLKMAEISNFKDEQKLKVFNESLSLLHV